MTLLLTKAVDLAYEWRFFVDMNELIRRAAGRVAVTPELQTPAPSMPAVGNAGAGVGQEPMRSMSMNEAIRYAAATRSTGEIIIIPKARTP